MATAYLADQRVLYSVIVPLSSSLWFILQLFWRAFLVVVLWMGTSALSVAVKIIFVPVAIFLVKVWRQSRRVMWQRIRENLEDTAIATVSIWAILIGYNMFYSIPHKINEEARKAVPDYETIQAFRRPLPPNQDPIISLSLALVTKIYRMRDPETHGYMNGGQSDVIGILRVQQQHGVSARHIRSLQIVGEEPADFNTFAATFGENDGTESEDDIEARYLKLKPFFNLSWVIFPTTQENVDPTDDKFLKFVISDSMGAFVFRGRNLKDLYGFESTKHQPKLLSTNPVWYQLVRFTRVDPADQTGTYPTLRDEVKTGKVKNKSRSRWRIDKHSRERNQIPLDSLAKRS